MLLAVGDLGNAAPLVEGIANEVLICVAILLAALILVVAWISTHVQHDTRPIAVFVFENLGRFRNRERDVTSPAVNATDTASVATEQAEPEPLPSPQPEAEPTDSSHLSYDVDFLDSDCAMDSETRQHVEEVIQEYTEVVEAKSDTELRNRRLKYFNCLFPERASTSAVTSTSLTEDISHSVDSTTLLVEPPHSETTPTLATPVTVISSTVASSFTAVTTSTTNTTTSSTAGSIQVKLKYFNDDLKTVFASPSESIAHFKAKHFHLEMSRNMNIRLIYNGRELKEGSNRTLESYSIPECATIHCLITERMEDTDPHPDSEGSGPSSGVLEVPHDIGGLMFPLFGVILALIWYCRICYRIYFNFFSTLALSAVTLLFFAACLASWTARSARIQQPIQVHRINLENSHTPAPASSS